MQLKDPAVLRTCRIFKAARLALGQSQVDFGVNFGLSQPNVSKIEALSAAPSLMTWVSLCQAFQVPMDCIQSESGTKAALIGLIDVKRAQVIARLSETLHLRTASSRTERSKGRK